MGAYGDPYLTARINRAACDDKQVIFTARFTTAGAGAPTIDTAKTRGVVSIARTGTGITTITLPVKLKNVSIQVSQAGGTTAQVPCADMAEAAATATVTTVTAGGSTAADSTGIICDVLITGTVR